MTDRLQPGEKFRVRAGAWNAMLDAAEAHRAGQSTGGPITFGKQFSTIRVKNTTGGDRQQYDAVAMGGFRFDPADNLPDFKAFGFMLEATQPDADSYGRFAILLEPLAVNAIGWAAVSGICPARVGGCDEDTRFVEIGDEAGNLIEHWAGTAEVLALSEDAAWALVRLGCSGIKSYPGVSGSSGVPALSGSTPGSGTVTIQRINEDGDLEDVGTVEAFNNMGAAVGNSVKIQVKSDAFGVFWVDTENCA